MFNIENIFSKQFSINEVLRIMNFSDLYRRDPNYLESKDRRKAYNAVHNFSIPTFENGALSLLVKVFPQIKNKKFIMRPLKPSDVIEKDIEEIDVYCREKPFNIKDLDRLNEIIYFVNTSITNKHLDINASTVIETLPKNTSAGFPDYGKKGDEFSIKQARARLSELVKLDNIFNMYKYLTEYPVTIFHRFTPKMKLDGNIFSPNFKIRQILGQPFFIVVLEKLMFYNFVESFKSSFSHYYCIGLRKQELSDKISRLRRFAKDNSKVILCGDINGCDKSISKHLSLIYFSIASNFVNPAFRNIYESYILYFLRTPMIFGGGLRYSNGSTITGSWITSSFTTLSVMIPLIYSFSRLYNRYPTKEELLLQGDDFIICLNKESDKVLFKEYLLEFNLRLRLDKSDVVYWFQEIEFLGFKWDVYNKPDNTDLWIISKVLYPEKFMRFDGPLRIIYRILSIIINLKRFSALFYRFYNYDKVLRNMFDSNKLSSIILISEANELLKIRIPINEMLRLGWRIL